MNLITLDFETYYDQQYSLSKMTTEAYVRDPRFEVIGLGVHIDGRRSAVWVPQPGVDEFIRSVDWSRCFVLAQNTRFDGAILGWRYGVNPKGWLDTLGMSRALHPHAAKHSLDAQAARENIGVKGDEVARALGKRYADFTPSELRAYGEYCKTDVMLTRALFDTYAPKFPLSELQLIDVTLRMFIQPSIHLDEPLLHTHLEEVRAKKASLQNRVRDEGIAGGDAEIIAATIGGVDGEDWLKKILMSNDRFAGMLRKYGVEPPTKISPATGRTTYAFAKTDEAFQSLADHPDPLVQALHAARVGTKSTLEETRTERFIGAASRGPFPVPLQYYGAHSGRWAGTDSVNLQNLPSRGKGANTLKRAMRAPQGHVFIDCDSSQIEARVLAWAAGQQDLVDMFARGEDTYVDMACDIYGLASDQIDPTKRAVGKTVILGAGYGVGPPKLQAFLKTQARVEVSDDEARRIIQAYRRKYPKIPALWGRGDAALRAMALGSIMAVDVHDICVTGTNSISLPNGLHLQYPDLRPTETSPPGFIYISRTRAVNVYGGKVIENLCQALARIIIGEQMLRIRKRYKPVLTVHDATGIIAPAVEQDEARAYVEECMRWRPSWCPDLPLACESGMGASYGDC